MRRRTFILAGCAAAVAGALLFSPLASRLPDGLVSCAQKWGIAEKAFLPAPFAGYAVPRLHDPYWSRVLAGGAGALAAFALAVAGGRLLRRKKDR